MTTTSGGIRHNKGKPRYDLISPIGLEALAKVYTTGAEEYGDRNWEKGLSLMGCFASLMRHAWKWAMGETYDKESGSHHMAHVMWNACAIVHLSYTKPEYDDRVSCGRQD